MDESEIQGASIGCPHCPTRQQCACPDGPEKCPDNPSCPCDKSVCPCAKPASGPDRPPWLRPPGCLVWIILGLLVVVVIVIIVVRGGDDQESVTTPESATTLEEGAEADTVPPDESTAPSVSDAVAPVETEPAPPDTEAPPATDPPPPATEAPVTTEAPPPPTTIPGPPPDAVDLAETTKVTEEDVAVFDEVGAQLFTASDCQSVTAGMREVHQSGASPLIDPSLDINMVCVSRTTQTGEIDMLVGDFVVVGMVTDGPSDVATEIAHQPGLGIDRSAVPNADAQADGEGLLRHPGDTVAFGTGEDGWTEANFFSLPEFGGSDLFGYSYFRTGSTVSVFAVPADALAFDTVFNVQMFGRQTATGATATETDPAASTFVFGGPAACDGPCQPAAGRFEVQVNWADLPDPVFGAEGDPGSFWFVTPSDLAAIIRMFDGCSTDGFNSFWVFAAATTDVVVDITVTDTQSGEFKTYDNPLGTAFPAIVDTQAFATCP